MFCANVRCQAWHSSLGLELNLSRNFCIGDKPQSFVGSREWIGAIELGYVLDEQLGVTAKVITVASGAEMGTKSREIAQHFDNQGTPIMVRLPCTCFFPHQSAAQ